MQGEADIQKIVCSVGKLDVSKFDSFSLWLYDLRFFRWLRSVRHFWANLLFNRFDLVCTGLSKSSWHDSDTRMLYGVMNLVAEFVDKECAFSSETAIDWEYDDDHSQAKEAIMSAYEWWKDYPRRQDEIEAALMQWSKEAFPGGHFRGGTYRLTPVESEKATELSDKLHKMQDDLDAEEQQMLHKVIDVRKFMWT